MIMRGEDQRTYQASLESSPRAPRHGLYGAEPEWSRRERGYVRPQVYVRRRQQKRVGSGVALNLVGLGGKRGF